MARLILLNGMPGIGKSTLARRYAAAHPGTLACDIDVLRTMIGGWEDDFGGAGARIRPAALGLIGGYLREAGDVVLPQLLARTGELERFERAAVEAGAEFAEIMLVVPGDDAADAVGRFARRDDGTDPWHAIVQDIVAGSGGEEALRDYHERLGVVARERASTRFVTVHAGDVDGTYAALVAVLDAM